MLAAAKGRIQHQSRRLRFGEGVGGFTEALAEVGDLSSVAIRHGAPEFHKLECFVQGQRVWILWAGVDFQKIGRARV